MSLYAMSSIDDQTVKDPDDDDLTSTRLKIEENNAFLLDTIVDGEHQVKVNVLPSCLETVPNELLFFIISYLNSPDLVQAFYGLNQRFNSIVNESARHFKLPDGTPLVWFAKYMTCIENVIETIVFDVKLMPSVFPSTHSYRNLCSIILKNSLQFTVELRVEHDSAFSSIISSLKILRMCNVWVMGKNEQTPLFIDSHVNTAFNTSPCPAIEHLSILTVDERNLFRLCALTPNLIKLRIRFLSPGAHYRHHTSIAAVVARPMRLAQPTHLAQLQITYNSTDGIHLSSIARLIGCYQSSLERLSLLINSSYLLIDGRRLEALLQPCRQLKKLAFIFQYDGKQTDADELLHQFQSDWWLDARQPPVLIVRDDTDHIFIGSMPCGFPLYFNFPTDLNAWRLNKKQLDSPLICFTKETSVNLKNSNEWPITLDFLHFIVRVFRSRIQWLNFQYWGFVSPHILFEQLISTITAIPMLPNVMHFNPSFSKLDGLDGMTLIIWLLLAPNVRELSLQCMTNTDKIQLAKELSEMLAIDERLRPIFYRIKKVNLFSNRDNIDKETKLNMLLIFASVFPKMSSLVYSHLSTFS